MTNKRYKPISRRTVLRISGVAWGLSATGGWAFAKSDFWNQKDSSEWSDTEREHILTNSPWARKATVSVTGNGLSDGGPMGGGGGSMGGRGGGGSMGGGMGGGGGRGGGGGDMGGGRGGAAMGGAGGPAGGGMPKFDVTVRWESAAPIRDAVKEAVPAEPDAYVMGVIGMPSMNMGRRGGAPRGMATQPHGEESNTQGQEPGDQDNLERLQQTAQIEVKGQAPLHPRKVDREEGPGGQRIVFHFDKAELPITAASKEVIFSMRMGAVAVKAKFTTKDMVYKDRLSL